jgi:hypothetical protein
VETGKAAERPSERRRNGLKAKKLPTPGQTGAGRGADSGPGEEASWEGAKWQAGTDDPGMEASERRQPLQARERPLRATGSVEEQSCEVPGSIDPEEEKST